MASNVFTTHTPVPAGIDMFPPDLITKYFKSYHPRRSSSTKKASSRWAARTCRNKKQGFSMAVLAIRLADSYNGVSKLHGEVSRQDVAQPLAAACPLTEVPIKHVTNGIHVRIVAQRRTCSSCSTAISARSG